MGFDDLRYFIEKSMRMSHVYQPVMLMTLLQKGGQASVREIAADILSHDESQLEYYDSITKEMVGKVLRGHGIVRKEGEDFYLEDFASLTQTEVADLTTLLGQKLQDFKAKRGELIWQHRKMSAGYVSGTIRYEVLKRAQFHCVLCGVSADEKALEVDHIIPRSHGGTDDLSNFQALCYSCNAMKQNRDATDFRKVIESYSHREQGCVFCHLPPERIVKDDPLCVAIKDLYPVTVGHVLVIPKRHTADYFDLSQAELTAAHELISETKAQILASDASVEGFNVGINCGEVAGQTVFHCHIHLIPRRRGDVSDPSGGVRNVIPGAGAYVVNDTSRRR